MSEGFERLNSLVREGRFEEAAECLGGIALSRGETWETWKWRGLLREKEGRLGEARACLRKALELGGPRAEGLAPELERMAQAARAPSAGDNLESADGLERILRITFACNQRCPFCFVELSGRKVGLNRVKRALRGLSDGIGDKGLLTISGGEPASDSRLPDIVKTARRAGLRRFSLQTNAVFLADAALTARLVRLGVEDYFVSFHSHKPALYDRMTGSRGQFPRALEGLKNILAAGARRVVCNVVVTALNYEDLPELAAFLAGLKAGPGVLAAPGVTGAARTPPQSTGGVRPELFLSMINDVGLRKASGLAVSLEAVAPWLNRAVGAARREGLPVIVFSGACAFPACLLDDPGALVPARPMDQAGTRYAETFAGPGPEAGRAKRPACRECPHDGGCLGVPAEYARRFGLGALRPPAGRKGA